jgi:hypothetical protein
MPRTRSTRPTEKPCASMQFMTSSGSGRSPKERRARRLQHRGGPQFLHFGSTPTGHQTGNFGLAEAEPLPLVCGIDVQLHRIVGLLRASARDRAQTDDDAGSPPGHHYLLIFDDTGSALQQRRPKRCASKDQLDCLTHPTPLKCSRTLYIPAGAQRSCESLALGI